MTEHLPECQPESVPDPPFICICPELRACEQRVIAAAVQQLQDYLQHDVADGWMPREKADGIVATINGTVNGLEIAV